MPATIQACQNLDLKRPTEGFCSQRGCDESHLKPEACLIPKIEHRTSRNHPTKNLFGWGLASVYVKPEFRSKGIGSKLVRHVMQFISQFNIPELYLFTEDQVSLYARLGWVSISEETYRKTDVTVMKTTING